MSDILDGKTVVVTGGASGLGRATAIGAARHGAKAVIIGDLLDSPREGGPPAQDEVAALGAVARFVRCDVTKRADVDALIATASEFDGVDLLVANAGITAPSDGLEVLEAEYKRVLAVNLDGVLFSAQAAAQQMKALGKRGSIVLIASMGGILGSRVTVAYSTSKGGVVLMAKALADALGPDGIRVNSVSPGTIDTELVRSTPAITASAESFRIRTPLRRYAQASEIADAVAWLGSDLSSYVTATTLVVDGGLTGVL
ncbi:SDR family NAD(P)-dependent oxidoreductase [Kribbella sp. NPDC058245]|uniref:SDR family NAD(P)-dependent oxidoreductase n=1 Tax=Kribbella sp. NPDC058245 TaxID=3346399 RepID=UPI0036ECAE51